MDQISRFRVLSRNQVKYIALAAMILDHIGFVFCTPDTPVYEILRTWIGRMAFPIFCALFVDAFFYIKRETRWKHLLVLVGFTILSEVPFDMMSGQWFDLSNQSIMMTWLLAFVLMWCLSEIYSKRSLISVYGAVVLQCVVIFGFMALADCMKVDYYWVSMLAVGLAYLLEQTIPTIDIIFIGITVCLVTLMGTGYPTVFFALCPICLYDGHRLGRKDKYIHYVAYPAHMFVIGLLSHMV